mgnify:CR=1 FL=1
MHELGVTFHIMDHLEKVAKENEVEKIRKVVLELGSLDGDRILPAELLDVGGEETAAV